MVYACLDISGQVSGVASAWGLYLCISGPVGIAEVQVCSLSGQASLQLWPRSVDMLGVGLSDLSLTSETIVLPEEQL